MEKRQEGSIERTFEGHSNAKMKGRKKVENIKGSMEGRKCLSTEENTE